MRFHIADEKGKALCETCRRIAPTTFAYRDVPFSDGPGTVKGLLVAVCDRCGAIIAIPPQSTPAIRAARDTANRSIEVMLPAPYVELLDLAAFRIDPAATAESRKRLLIFYVHRFAANRATAAKVARLASTLPRSLEGMGRFVPKRRLSFKVTSRTLSEMEGLMKAASLNRTDVIRGLLRQIDEDIVRSRAPGNLVELRALAAA